LLDHLSISQINLYRACSLRYKFTYIDELPKPFKPSGLAFGTVIHSAIEWFHKERLKSRRPSVDEVYEVLLTDWEAQKADNIRFREGETEGSLLSKAKELLELYVAAPPAAEVTHVELPFEVPIVDFSAGEVLEVPLRGVIDIIEGGDTVVELKTSARSIDVESIRQNLQLTAYSFAYRILYGTLPKLRLDCLLKTKKPRLERVETERSKEDHHRLVYLLREAWKGIKCGVFFPNPGWICKDCEYGKYCFARRGDSSDPQGKAYWE